MAATRARPLTLHKLLKLSDLGIDGEALVAGAVSLESESHLCVRESVEDEARIVMVDIADPGQVVILDVDVDDALLKPGGGVLVLRSARSIKVVDLKLGTAVRRCVMDNDVELVTWLNDNTLALITTMAVYCWHVASEPSPLHVAHRIPELDGAAITSCCISPDSRWLAVAGVRADGGAVQLCSLFGEPTRHVSGRACAFVVYETGVLVLVYAAGTGAHAVVSMVDIAKSGTTAAVARQTVPLVHPPDAADDVPLALHALSTCNAVVCITQLGYAHVFDLGSGSCLSTTRVTYDALLATTVSSDAAGFTFVTNRGHVFAVRINGPALLQSAFGRLVDAGHLEAAAKLAACSPHGLLRTRDSLAALQLVPPHSGLPATVYYFANLPESARLTPSESAHLALVADLDGDDAALVALRRRLASWQAGPWPSEHSADQATQQTMSRLSQLAVDPGAASQATSNAAALEAAPETPVEVAAREAAEDANARADAETVRQWNARNALHGGSLVGLCNKTFHASECAYCHRKGESCRTYCVFLALALRPEDYALLIDRGFSRYGLSLYWPENAASCCPQYQIRLLASEFRPSRSKRRVLVRMRRFLAGEWEPRDGANPAPHTLRVERVRPYFHKPTYNLYVKYQAALHNDTEVTPSKFRNTFVNDPFVTDDATDGVAHHYGAWHYRYYIDNALVMVCAVDIVPGALVSNYCMYDPDLAFLKLGVYSVLQEIEWVVGHPDVASYYYMVYYVPGNERMAYKMGYQPTEFLCPVTLTWHPSEPLLPRLDGWMRLAPPDPLDELCLTALAAVAGVDDAAAAAALKATVTAAHGLGITRSNALASMTAERALSLMFQAVLVGVGSLAGEWRLWAGNAGTRLSLPDIQVGDAGELPPAPWTPDPGMRVKFGFVVTTLGELLEQTPINNRGLRLLAAYERAVTPELLQRLVIRVG
ncbi:arginyl-tRNA-protein transferase 1 [Thecamonas trahens ATCC 50062]|uniref:arginyltransferase n=1 Tax=Thecamonas trahens ATCC 50062 TaxID=461836 RepID=A0A0L0DFM5_THETB|nr:arginyl-tRNA-protein transferase 1 [Thecamonas trahens ATCC 50062]KNC50966.1 arginyl-tRNA-protein transferase 1 [Thecamonas trahens ATCC 50062]|eukprot:XP_013756662.1 arginyl-tRNA-protein transferase 1 [Thecamonas trahens ATCC 50062]